MTLVSTFVLAVMGAQEWPRWRGPEGSALSPESGLPVEWSTTRNVAWKIRIPGEGASSPIVWGDSIFVTSALEEGTRRVVHCLDRRTGDTRWRKEIADDNPEIASALTGHAAATPVTDGERVIAFFGNAGVVCFDFDGKRLWHRTFGEFDSELGLASSPVIHEGNLILVCDHDGDRFTSFDSFMIALDLMKGTTVWKTSRPKLFRSWSTPIVVTSDRGAELIVSAQDELRAYDTATGKLRWKVPGMTGWVTPSPVFGKGLIFATSGKNGPTLAVEPGGRVVWRDPKGAPYVCSPLFHKGLLYVHTEQGLLTCRDAVTGKIVYRSRLGGKFSASGIAGDGKIYLTNEMGLTYVLKAGKEFRIVSENALGEECLASPAVSRGMLFIRTRQHLYAIQE